VKTLSSKIVKTRKQHQCFYCIRNFPKKTKMMSCTFVDNGKISTNYQCKTCQELFKTVNYSSMFFGYYGEVFQGCVFEALRELDVSTPEELLIVLEKQQRNKNETFSIKN